MIVNGGASIYLIEHLELRDLPSSPPTTSHLLGPDQWSGQLENGSQRGGVYLPPLEVNLSPSGTSAPNNTPATTSMCAPSAPCT